MFGNSTKKLTNEFILERCQDLPDTDNYDFSKTKYINSRTKLVLICNKHGEFLISPKQIIEGRGCSVCDRLSNKNPKSHLSLSQYKVLASLIHKNKYAYSLVNDLNISDEKIPIICPIHGEFKTRRSAHISPSQEYGCQKCSRGYSKYEEQIEDFLIEHNIEYQYQKTFDGFVSGSKQKYAYDFYIPHLKLLIEFDGPHHYMPIKFAKTQTKESQKLKLERVKCNDRLKEEFAFKQDMQLLRIMHTRAYDIESILAIEVLDMPSIEGHWINGIKFDGPLKTVICYADGKTYGNLINYF